MLCTPTLWVHKFGPDRVSDTFGRIIPMDEEHLQKHNGASTVWCAG